MASKVIYVVLALLAAASAAPSPPESRIVGGIPTTIEEFPYIVAFIYFYPGPGIYIQRCVGCLISSFHVMGSAFCFTGANIGQTLIRAGSTNSMEGGVLSTLNRWIVHPDFVQAPRAGDIALTTLNFPLPISDVVGVLFLPPQNMFIADGIPVKIVSWGFETEQGPQLENLKEITLNKLPLADCQEIYRDSTNVVIHDPVICASQPGPIGMCLGDSGAPMVLENPGAASVVVGVASYYQGCGDNYWPDVFSRIDRFTEWILEVATAPNSNFTTTDNRNIQYSPKVANFL